MLRTPALLFLTALLFSACADLDPRHFGGTVYVGGFHSHHLRAPRARIGQVDRISYWHGYRVSGKPSIRISLREQRAYFYKSDRLVGVSVISSGREGFDTKPGNFKIIQKSKDHVSSRFGDYVDHDGRIRMPGFMAATFSTPWNRAPRSRSPTDAVCRSRKSPSPQRATASPGRIRRG